MSVRGNFWLGIVIGALGGAIVALLFSLNFNDERPEEVIQAYLQALESKNEPSLQELTARTSVSEQLIKRKLEEFGGHQLNKLQVCYKEVKPQLVIATIEGNYNIKSNQNRSFSEQINLVYERTILKVL